MNKKAQAALKIEAAFRDIIEALGMMGHAVKSDDNFTETSGRAARALMELIRPVDEIREEVDRMLARTFPARYDEMVISKHNICFGVCPHHLLPVVYRVSVAYLPGERVLGISKLSRLVQLNSYHPARRFGLWPRKGSLQAGADADLVLVDLDEERAVKHTGHGHCIYEGWKLKGWPVLTIARGEVVYENGAVNDTLHGRGRCVIRPAGEAATA